MTTATLISRARAGDASVLPEMADTLERMTTGIRQRLAKFRLTARQLEIAEFIDGFTEAVGFAPTMQEIADELKVSKVTVFEHLSELERKGAITRPRYASRGIRITA